MKEDVAEELMLPSWIADVREAIEKKQAETGVRPQIAIVPDSWLGSAPGADLRRLEAIVIPARSAVIVGDNLEPSVVDLRARIAYLERREAHGAKVLGVSDGGQYRADWDSRLKGLVADNEQLRAQVAALVAEREKTLVGQRDLIAQAAASMDPEKTATGDVIHLAESLETLVRNTRAELGSAEGPLFRKIVEICDARADHLTRASRTAEARGNNRVALTLAGCASDVLAARNALLALWEKT